MNTLTSRSLQEKYPDIYRDFFVHHDIIYSIPLSTRFGIPGIESKNSIPYVLMKSPRRCYIGIKTGSKKGLCNIIYHEDGFITQKLSEFHSGFQSIAIGSDDEINFLCENNDGHSFGILSVISGLLAIHKTKNTSNLDILLQETRKIEKYFEGEEATADRLFIGFIKPLFGLYAFDYKNDQHHYNTEHINEELGFDIAIHYSGYTANSERARIAQKTKETSFHYFDQEIEYIDALLGYDSKTSNRKEMEEFLQNLQKLFTSSFYKLINNPLDDQIREHFGEICTSIKDSLQLIGYSNHLLSALDKNKSIISIPLFTGLISGSLLSIIPLGLRKEFCQLISSIQESNPTFTKEYYSREDEGIINGLTIEQDLGTGILSKWLSHGEYIYTNNLGVKDIGSLSDLTDKHSEGILVNAIDGKISCNGNKLTSKDLESQSTTAEVLQICLRNLGQEVWNSEFSSSSMTKQYNQFLSKIIIPLQKVIQREMNLELDIKVKSVLGRFHCRLSEKRFPIGVISKLI